MKYLLFWLIFCFNDRLMYWILYRIYYWFVNFYWHN